MMDDNGSHVIRTKTLGELDKRLVSARKRERAVVEKARREAAARRKRDL